MLSKQSIKNLRRVAKFLFAEPRRFNMNAGVEPTLNHVMKEQPPCGTACCIGGAAYLIKNKTKLIEPLELGWNRVAGEAVVFLDLQKEQEGRLFHVSSWPLAYKTLYNEAKTAHELAAVGVLRIEHFISTGGDE